MTEPEFRRILMRVFARFDVWYWTMSRSRLGAWFVSIEIADSVRIEAVQQALTAAIKCPFRFYLIWLEPVRT